MSTWKYSTTGQRVESRGGIAPWHEHTLFQFVAFVPLNGDSVRPVFGGNSKVEGEPLGPDIL